MSDSLSQALSEELRGLRAYFDLADEDSDSLSMIPNAIFSPSSPDECSS